MRKSLMKRTEQGKALALLFLASGTCLTALGLSQPALAAFYCCNPPATPYAPIVAVGPGCPVVGAGPCTGACNYITVRNGGTCGNSSCFTCNCSPSTSNFPTQQLDIGCYLFDGTCNCGGPPTTGPPGGGWYWNGTMTTVADCVNV